jgi:hypothetical protein
MGPELSCNAPQLSGGASVCIDNNKTQLKLTGSVGVIQWESSPDNITFTLIPDSAAATLTIDTFKTKTYYRAVVTEVGCSALTSNIESIQVDTLSLSATISGSARVCIAGNSITLQLPDYRGAIQWQSSPDRVNFTSISNSVNPILNIVNIVDTMY